ncbi:MAG TPA: VOC family protein [Dehalococcoidia bacterium]|nr:VOC family protein [Dehalococcoidia bacterium]
MPLTGFDHYTVRASDLQRTWRFYEEVLGLRVEKREGGSAPGCIAYVGDAQIAHIFQATPEQEAVFSRIQYPDEETRSWPSGRLQHVGFWATGVPEFRARLQANNVPFRERAMPDKYQFALRDPDGLEIEVNFPLSEAPAS